MLSKILRLQVGKYPRTLDCQDQDNGTWKCARKYGRQESSLHAICIRLEREKERRDTDYKKFQQHQVIRFKRVEFPADDGYDGKDSGKEGFHQVQG